jgi:adenylate cyclase
MDPQLRKAGTFEALRDVAHGAAAQLPQVLVIEDLHWIDPASVEFLSYFIDHVPGHRILLVLTHRPEFEPPLGTRPFFTSIDLRQLSGEESAAIASGLLGDGGLPSELATLLFGKSEGNPFFLEEVTRSLVGRASSARAGTATSSLRHSTRSTSPTPSRT